MNGGRRPEKMSKMNLEILNRLENLLVYQSSATRAEFHVYKHRNRINIIEINIINMLISLEMK